eukprot:1660345-Rhodomonas_salina.3
MGEQMRERGQVLGMQRFLWTEGKHMRMQAASRIQHARARGKATLTSHPPQAASRASALTAGSSKHRAQCRTRH